MKSETKRKLYTPLGVLAFFLFLILVSFIIFVGNNFRDDPEFRAKMKSVIVPNSLVLQLSPGLNAQDFGIKVDGYNNGEDLVVFDGNEYKAIPTEMGEMIFSIYHYDDLVGKFEIDSSVAWKKRNYWIKVYTVDNQYFYDINIDGPDGYVKENIEGSMIKNQ